MASINLFPIEEKQTLRTDKLKVNFRFNSYNSYVEIKNDSKELQIYFESKIIQDQILRNIKELSNSYSHDVEYLEELAKYFVENINQEVKK